MPNRKSSGLPSIVDDRLTLRHRPMVCVDPKTTSVSPHSGLGKTPKRSLGRRLRSVMRRSVDYPSLRRSDRNRSYQASLIPSVNASNAG
jgi:hypothetical protein